MTAKPWWLLAAWAMTGYSHGAEALDPAFIDYLVQFADDKELFDAADYALIKQSLASDPAPKTEPQPERQAIRPVAKEPKP
jgi:hypothetical protein